MEELVITAALTGNITLPNYTSDLRNLLAKSSTTEQRIFLKSFVEKIETDDEKVKMYYTISVSSDSIAQETT